MGALVGGDQRRRHRAAGHSGRRHDAGDERHHAGADAGPRRHDLPSCAAYAPPIVQEAVHDRLLGLPIVLWLWLAVIVFVSFVLGMTRFGRHAYMVGNNARASHLAGVNVAAVTIVLYTLSGFFRARRMCWWGSAVRRRWAWAIRICSSRSPPW